MTKNIYTLEFQENSPFTNDETLHEQEESFSTLKKSTLNETPKPLSESTPAIDVQTNSIPITHSSQIIPFYDPSFSKHKTYFQSFFFLMITP